MRHGSKASRPLDAMSPEVVPRRRDSTFSRPEPSSQAWEGLFSSSSLSTLIPPPDLDAPQCFANRPMHWEAPWKNPAPTWPLRQIQLKGAHSLATPTRSPHLPRAAVTATCDPSPSMHCRFAQSLLCSSPFSSLSCKSLSMHSSSTCRSSKPNQCILCLNLSTASHPDPFSTWGFLSFGRHHCLSFLSPCLFLLCLLSPVPQVDQVGFLTFPHLFLLCYTASALLSYCEPPLLQVGQLPRPQRSVAQPNGVRRH